MRLAVLGGSFNPIHMGHLFLADAVLSKLGYDRVVLVPAFRSPFKLAAQGMEDSTHNRLEMIAASIAGDPRLTLDDCEIRRGGVSFT
ncbi:MAG: nicotinate-nicotinamide nucleotide adenylyltransferase, partial [Treponema sp.]|nr:nicotinate-nicotinamide nucleotide adenylyltransferase [Treponema sp.]